VCQFGPRNHSLAPSYGIPKYLEVPRHWTVGQAGKRLGSRLAACSSSIQKNIAERNPALFIPVKIG